MIAMLLMSVALAGSPSEGVSSLAHVETFSITQPTLFA